MYAGSTPDRNVEGKKKEKYLAVRLNNSINHIFRGRDGYSRTSIAVLELVVSRRHSYRVSSDSGQLRAAVFPRAKSEGNLR